MLRKLIGWLKDRHILHTWNNGRDYIYANFTEEIRICEVCGKVKKIDWGI